ncbi:unnamed protein product, partial [Rotaria sp. Silwood1]
TCKSIGTGNDRKRPGNTLNDGGMNDKFGFCSAEQTIRTGISPVFAMMKFRINRLFRLIDMNRLPKSAE